MEAFEFQGPVPCWNLFRWSLKPPENCYVPYLAIRTQARRPKSRCPVSVFNKRRHSQRKTSVTARPCITSSAVTKKKRDVHNPPGPEITARTEGRRDSKSLDSSIRKGMAASVYHLEAEKRSTCEALGLAMGRKAEVLEKKITEGIHVKRVMGLNGL